MYYIIDEQNHVQGYGESYLGMEGCKTIELDIEIDLNKSFAYVYDGNSLVFSQELYDKVMAEKEITELRNRRQEECFSIVNRGEVWYTINVNTDERKEEFNDWYNAWLNVTETKVIPDKPDWIN